MNATNTNVGTAPDECLDVEAHKARLMDLYREREARIAEVRREMAWRVTAAELEVFRAERLARAG